MNYLRHEIRHVVIAVLLFAYTQTSALAADIRFLVSAIDSNQPVTKLSMEMLNVTVDGKACSVSTVDSFSSVTLGFLLDTSGSTREMFKKEVLAGPLQTVLNALPNAATFVVTSNGSNLPFVKPTRHDVNDILGAIPEKHSGGTTVFDTLIAVADGIRDRTGLVALIYFTDGDDNSSSRSLGDVLQRFSSLNVPVFPTVQQLGPTPDPDSRTTGRRESVMQLIAAASGGRVIHFLNAKGLDQLFHTLGESLLYTFRVTASCDEKSARPGPHNMKVKLNGMPKAVVTSRSEYLVPKP